MLYYSYTQTFSLVYCIVAIVIVCHFVRSLMAFVCQKIKELLTYLLTYLIGGLLSVQRVHDCAQCAAAAAGGGVCAISTRTLSLMLSCSLNSELSLAAIVCLNE